MVRDAPKKIGLGFQLDVVIFLVAVAVLSLAGFHYYSNYSDDAKVSRCKAELSLLGVAVSQYAYEMHAAPTLADLAAKDKTYNNIPYGPWIHSATPKDPWGNFYVLTITTDKKGYVVYSKGPGGKGSALSPTNITGANNNMLGVFVQKLNGKPATIAYYGRFGDL